jgi:hypothetical protein
MSRIDRELERLWFWHGEISKAAAAFEQRWSMRALQRVDGQLYVKLMAQKQDTDQAFIVSGGADGISEVERHAPVMCRGWAAAIKAMEESGEEDDAYMIGWDARTGARVAIGPRVCADRVVEAQGKRCTLLTPDEIATMYVGLEGFKTIDAIKQKFPGAEVVDVHHDQPAKGDWNGQGQTPD